MRRFRDGDLGALGLLYDRHQRQVYAMCHYLTGDASAADDLAQESFLRVLRYGESFDARSRFTTWLFRVARNVCHDFLARKGREAERVERCISDAADDRLYLPNADSRLDLVRQALFRLPSAHREVLVLSRFEDMKYADIAELFDTTVEAVKARAYRAMRALRREYAKLERRR